MDETPPRLRITESSSEEVQDTTVPDQTPERHEAELFADDLKPDSQLLAGQYKILSFLNAGGFGITYLARDSLDRTVVVKECFPNALCHRVAAKVLPRSRKHAAEFRAVVQAFLDEARSLAKIVHPGIVGVHQVFEDNGTAYMAIDFIDGKDLHDILESTDSAFTPDEVVSLLMRMLSAVEFIHQIGILHRDISPDNILIDKMGKPVLIDFGAAAEQLTPDSRIVTARRVVKEGYSPQELYLTGAEQTASSDLYALGATFYHVISGKPPPNSQRRLSALASGTPDPCPPLAGRFPGYPPGFLESIDAALRVLQKDRLQSASAWIELVEDGLAKDEVAKAAQAADSVARTRPASAADQAPAATTGRVPGKSAPRTTYRNRLLGAAAGTVLVLVIVGLWVVLS